MVGETISHYRVTDKLGEGGMGVVYKAEDTKLERSVALKFLAAHAIEDPEHQARFLREAKAAARLDHQNICSVYEIGETAGRTFLAMANFRRSRTVISCDINNLSHFAGSCNNAASLRKGSPVCLSRGEKRGLE